MKKLTWLALVMSLVLIVAACGKKNDNAGSGSSPSASASASASDSASPSPSESAAGKTYKIGISQIVEHPSLDATREGFLAALKDAGLEEGKNLTVDFNTAQGDPSNNTAIAQKLANDKDDLVLGIATPSAQALVQNVKNAPILFAAVTDPLAAQIVKDMNAPGGNVTGASDTNPEATTKLVEFIAANFPKVKTVGLVINEGETNAVVMAKKAEEELGKKGIKLIKAPVTNTSEVKQAAESLVGKADAFYITLDNMVVSGVDSIIQVAQKNKIPFFSSDRDTVEKGAFATVGFKYYDHGYQVGQMAADILLHGKKPGDMPVLMQQKLDLILNLKVAKDYGIEVTDAMKNAVQDQSQNLIQ
ncbi:ABC transporter substrate-binding protein [Cohnella candidum]|uniref:ABC transporter substrate-binding protein n=1 Tax=Cohnella candidum TaxID=2674991 RepID=A0A3G3K488_9BACL|nr:ABC transporter substrate-binding protein [Cohnella candidum]AYQ75334.1 ABC transporter substrate-binding protein [Cohnella candidum]